MLDYLPVAPLPFILLVVFLEFCEHTPVEVQREAHKYELREDYQLKLTKDTSLVYLIEHYEEF